MTTKVLSVSAIKYYYVVVGLVYFLAIYVPVIRTGLFMSLIMGFGIFALYKNKKYILRKGLDMLVLGYISYATLTGFFYLFSDIPISVFFREFSNSILPIILFYFFGRLNYGDKFYKITVGSLALCCLLGFYYQLTLPMIYMERMDVVDGSGRNPLGYTDFRSLFGLTVTGSLASISLFLSVNFLFKDNSHIAKFFMLIFGVALIASFRRSAMYSAVIALAVMNIIVLFKYKRRGVKLIVFEAIGLFMLTRWALNAYPDLLFELIDRFNGISSAIGERRDNWFNGLSNTNSVITGDGLGRYGHKVIEFSDLYIPDGAYFLMIAEIGIIGFILFLAIIVTALFKALVKIKTHYVPFIIVLMVCAQAIGSNMFSFQLVAPIFWYSIGACNKLDHVCG